MIAMLELKSAGGGEPLYINPEYIAAIFADNFGATFVYVGGIAPTFAVKDTPQEIFEKIKEINRLAPSKKGFRE